MDYQNIPAIPPPPGVVSNFNNPKTLAPSLIAVNATFLSLMLIAVSIRIYSRGFIVRALGWDDCNAHRACKRMNLLIKTQIHVSWLQ